jgi:hypothetical protein
MLYVHHDCARDAANAIRAQRSYSIYDHAAGDRFRRPEHFLDYGQGTDCGGFGRGAAFNRALEPAKCRSRNTGHGKRERVRSTVTAKVGGVAANVNVTDENTLTLTIATANSGPEDIVLSRGDGATYTLENAVALP